MKILYLFDAADWDSRMAVAHLAQVRGFEVVIGLIDGSADVQVRAPEFRIIPLKRSEGRIGLLSSLRMVRGINALIRQEKPDIVHAVTLKYGFMTGFAAFSFKNMRKIYTLAGLGYVFRSDELKSMVLRMALRPFLTLVLRRRKTTLIFQNLDDLELMVAGRYARRAHCVLIRGSGVYLDRFDVRRSDADEVAPIVLMPTRLVHEKGVAVFVAAARLLKQRGVQTRFQSAGGETKHNPKAI